MKEKKIHMNEDQVLLSLIDENDLPKEMRSHLEGCKACQDKRASLLSELECLGKMAGKFTPAPRKRPILPVRESGRKRYHFPVFATGLASAVVVAFLCSVVLFSDSPEQMEADLSVESEVRLHLMEEILEETALSGHYLDITQTSYSYFDDEFLEFVIPVEEGFDSVHGINIMTG